MSESNSCQVCAQRWRGNEGNGEVRGRRWRRGTISNGTLGSSSSLLVWWSFTCAHTLSVRPHTLCACEPLYVCVDKTWMPLPPPLPPTPVVQTAAFAFWEAPGGPVGAQTDSDIFTAHFKTTAYFLCGTVFITHTVGLCLPPWSPALGEGLCPAANE